MPICTLPSSTCALLSIWDLPAAASMPSDLRVISARPEDSSTDRMVPFTSLPLGNSCAGSETKVSARLHILTLASTDLEMATKHPPLFTCLTNPETCAPGASCETELIPLDEPLDLSAELFMERSTSPPSPTPRTLTSTASPTLCSFQGSERGSSAISVM